MIIKAFVLSDLHYPKTKQSRNVMNKGNVDGVNQFSTEYNVYSAFKKQLELFAKNKKKDYDDCILIITGDLTDKADMEGLEDCSIFLEECARILKISLKNVIIAVGNHDLCQTCDIEEQQKKFKEITDKFTTSFSDKCFYKNSNELLIYSFNSIAFHEEEYRVGFRKKKDIFDIPIIHKEEIDKFEAFSKDNNAKIKICLLHNHLLPVYGVEIRRYDILVNAGVIIRMLQDQNYSFVFHGHKHLFSEKIVQDLESTNPLPQVVIGFKDFSIDGNISEIDFIFKDGDVSKVLYSRYLLENNNKKQIGTIKDLWGYFRDYKKPQTYVASEIIVGGN